MKRVLLIVSIMCVFLCGCATSAGVRATNREKMNKLSMGMSKNDVLDTMGTKTIRTYASWTGTGPGEIITNPYRSEILKGKDKTFEVLYYYTDIKKSDGAITDDELTPFVFEDDILIGWGWSFLQDNMQKYEIRIR
jgi:hypothetical protein